MRWGGIGGSYLPTIRAHPDGVIPEGVASECWCGILMATVLAAPEWLIVRGTVL